MGMHILDEIGDGNPDASRDGRCAERVLIGTKNLLHHVLIISPILIQLTDPSDF